jgi:hypothetical protein
MENEQDRLAELDAIDLHWTLKDIAAKRTWIINKQHLAQLIDWVSSRYAKMSRTSPLPGRIRRGGTIDLQQSLSRRLRRAANAAPQVLETSCRTGVTGSVPPCHSLIIGIDENRPDRRPAVRRP